MALARDDRWVDDTLGNALAGTYLQTSSPEFGLYNASGAIGPVTTD
jgi:hypothetical protein